MPEIGQLSGSLEEKEQGFKPRSRIYAGPDWGWQTEESYNKIVQERNQGFGSEAVDFIEEKAGQAFGLISQIPGVKQGLDFAGGVVRFVDKTAIQPAIQAAEDPSQAGTPQALAGTVFKAGQMAEQGGAQIARNLGVDPRIGSAVAGAAYETVTGAAVGKIGKIADTLTPPGGGGLTPAMAGAGPQITIRGGSVNLQPTVMKAVTATDAPTLAGVRGGIQTGADLVSGAQGKRLIKRDLDIEGYRNTIETKINEMKALRELRGDPKRLKQFVDNASPELQAYWKSDKGNVDKIISRLDGNKKNAQEGLSRAQSNVLPFDTTKRAAEIGSSENVNYFRSKVGLTAKKAEESARAVQGYLEQHHLFPKGMSAAFFGKMDELISKNKATKDDLILMAEFTANQGRRTGDVKANLINMAKDPHNELHTILRAQGAELKKSDYVRMLENVDNVDDLLVKWRELLSGDAAYNIETAKIWEPLDDLLKEIQK